MEAEFSKGADSNSKKTQFGIKEWDSHVPIIPLRFPAHVAGSGLFFGFLVLLTIHDILKPHLPFVRFSDETICVLLFCYLLLKALRHRLRIGFITIALFLFVVYGLFLLNLENLPLSHIAQILISSKYLIILSVYCEVKKPESYISIFSTWLYLVNSVTLVMIVLQYVIGQPMFDLLHIPMQFRGELLRCTGIFSSPVQSAYFLFIALAFLCSKILWNRKLTVMETVLLIADITFLSLSLVRRFVIPMGVIAFFLILRKYKAKRIVFPMMLFLFFLGLLLTPLLLQNLKKYNSQVLDDPLYIRRILMTNGYEIAKKKFPFGSGPGTFGTKYSVEDYSPYYYDFGMDKTFHFHPGQKHMSVYDSFLASFTAEYGFLALLAYLGLVLWIWKRLYRERWRNQFVLFTIFIFIDFLFENFLTSLQTSLYGFFTFSIIALGLNLSLEKKEEID